MAKIKRTKNLTHEPTNKKATEPANKPRSHEIADKPPTTAVDLGNEKPSECPDFEFIKIILAAVVSASHVSQQIVWTCYLTSMPPYTARSDSIRQVRLAIKPSDTRSGHRVTLTLPLPRRCFQPNNFQVIPAEHLSEYETLEDIMNSKAQPATYDASLLIDKKSTLIFRHGEDPKFASFLRLIVRHAYARLCLLDD